MFLDSNNSSCNEETNSKAQVSWYSATSNSEASTSLLPLSSFKPFQEIYEVSWGGMKDS